MATSETGICNSALAKIGSYRITSLDDNTREAKLLKEQYAKVRDDLLRSHPWNFAIKRVSLALLTSEPAFGFAYEFQLPNDCLRVLETDSSNDIEWQREGNVIRTDTSTLAIKYVAKITEVGLFDACFAEVLASKLAADISFSIVQNATLKKQLNDEYMQKLREARSYDGQEGASRQVYANDWLNSRL